MTKPRSHWPIKLIDLGGGFQSRLFCEVEAGKDKVCSGNEIVFLFLSSFNNFYPILRKQEAIQALLIICILKLQQEIVGIGNDICQIETDCLPMVHMT